MALVTLPNMKRYSPKALRFFHPVFLCKKLMILSKKGAMARLRVKRSGRRKCCRVQKPVEMVSRGSEHLQPTSSGHFKCRVVDKKGGKNDFMILPAKNFRNSFH
jgi:hypothetical protein